MQKLFLIFILPLLFTACSNYESEAQQFVLGSLADPSSAQFGKFTLINTPHNSIKMACLTVNSKNNHGDYTGKKQATLMKVRDIWEITGMTNLNHEECIKALTLAVKAYEQTQ